MSDILSASSLLLTVIGILYGLWYPVISDVLKGEVKAHALDNRATLECANEVFRYKVLPLLIFSSLLVVIDLPDSIHIVHRAIQLCSQHCSSIWKHYNAVYGSFLLVEIVLMFLSLHMGRLAVQVRQKIARLS